jgi:hypothetical protein
MKFARTIFLIAGIYGLLVMLPQYFLEGRIGRDTPPPISHPEFYYGFIGVTIAWQILFLIISNDPLRYRVMMIPAVFGKGSIRNSYHHAFLAGPDCANYACASGPRFGTWNSFRYRVS